MIGYMTVALGAVPILVLAFGTMALDVFDATHDWHPATQRVKK